MACAGAVSCDNNGSGFKLYGGYAFNPAFTKNLKGVAAADFTTTDIYDDSAAVRMFTLGAQYNF